MYIGHGRLCVCLCVCLSIPRRIPTLGLLHRPGRNLGNGRGCRLVVHCWADLQSVHGFRCYDNIHVCKLIALYATYAYSAKREMSASACIRSIAGYVCVTVCLSRPGTDPWSSVCWHKHETAEGTSTNKAVLRKIWKIFKMEQERQRKREKHWSDTHKQGARGEIGPSLWNRPWSH